MSEPTTAEMIQQYIRLRDYVELKTKEFEASLKPYRDGMATLEGKVSQQIIDLGGESIKTEFGTAYRTTVMAVKMADRQAFMEFVTQDWGEREAFLTSAVTKDVVKDWIEQNNSKPPGLDIAYIHKTNFRRA
jgi:hypothetical protein